MLDQFLAQWAPTIETLPDLQLPMRNTLSAGNSWAQPRRLPAAGRLLKQALTVSTSTLDALSKSPWSLPRRLPSEHTRHDTRLFLVFETLCRQIFQSPSKCVAALTTHKIAKTFLRFSMANSPVESLLLLCMAEALCGDTTAPAIGIF